MPTTNLHAIDDATLSCRYQNTNYGALTRVYVGDAEADLGECRGLLRFDLSSIPAGSTINSASLFLTGRQILYGPDGSTLRLKVHPVLKPWTEAGATWQKYNGVNDWAMPGIGSGDVSAAIGELALEGDQPRSVYQVELSASVKEDLGSQGFALLFSIPEPGYGVVQCWDSVEFGGGQEAILSIDWSGPAYTGSAGLTLPALRSNIVGRAPPLVTGAAALTLPHVRATAAGTFAVPVYTAAALAVALPALDPGIGGVYADAMAWPALELPGQLLAAAGTAVAPVYTGALACALAALRAPTSWGAAQGTFVAPEYRGNLWKLFGPLTAAAAGEALHDTGVAVCALGGATAQISGTAADPVYELTASIVLPSLDFAAAGIHDPTVAAGELPETLPSVLASAAGTFLALPWATLPAVRLPAGTTEGAGTFVAPVYTGEAALGLGASVLASAGTPDAPTYSGTLDSGLSTLDFAAEGLATVPVYTGAVEWTLPAALLAAQGGDLGPVFGAGQILLPDLLAALTGDYTDVEVPGDYTGAGAIALPDLLAALIGDYTDVEVPGDYTGAGEIVLPNAALSGAGTYVDYVAPPETYTGEGHWSLVLGCLSSAGTAAAPVYLGGPASVLAALGFAAEGAFTTPVYSAVLAETLPAALLAGLGGYLGPATGAAAMILRKLTAAVVGGHTAPVYSGVHSVTLPACDGALSGTFLVPVYAGTLDPRLATLAFAAAAAATMRATWPVRAVHRHVAVAGSTDRLVVQPAARHKRVYQAHAKLAAVQNTPDLGA